MYLSVGLGYFLGGWHTLNNDDFTVQLARKLTKDITLVYTLDAIGCNGSIKRN